MKIASNLTYCQKYRNSIPARKVCFGVNSSNYTKKMLNNEQFGMVQSLIGTINHFFPESVEVGNLKLDLVKSSSMYALDRTLNLTPKKIPEGLKSVSVTYHPSSRNAPNHFYIGAVTKNQYDEDKYMKTLIWGNGEITDNESYPLSSSTLTEILKSLLP